MDRGNHYEAAFEAYLQHERLCYIAVDETRRTMLGELRVKNLDFIVYGDGGARLLVDVKGRRFPAGPVERPRRVWECWSTEDDVTGLELWERITGPGYLGVLVFVYHLLPGVEWADDAEDHWTWRGRRYLLRAVSVTDYRLHMRPRSPRWGTVALPGPVYRALAQPFHVFARRAQLVTEECPF
jgi:hypothetical protein